MNFANLKSTLKSNVAPAYFIFGSDIYLVQKSVDLIIDAAGVTDTQLNVSKLDEFASAEAIIAECRTVSFLGGRRVVIIRGVHEGQLTKALSAYLSAPNSDCILMLVSFSERSSILKNVELVDCNPMQPAMLVQLIKREFEKAGKSIAPDAAELLCRVCANYYSRINNEINKLLSYYTNKNNLTSDDILELVTKTDEYQIYELGSAICKKQIEKSQEILRVLQQSGIDDYAIFGNLVSHLRRVYYSLICKSSNEDVSSYLKCSHYAVIYTRRDHKDLQDKISTIYKKSLNYEYEIKSGKISVISAITQLQFEVFA